MTLTGHNQRPWSGVPELELRHHLDKLSEGFNLYLVRRRAANHLMPILPEVPGKALALAARNLDTRIRTMRRVARL